MVGATKLLLLNITVSSSNLKLNSVIENFHLQYIRENIKTIPVYTNAKENIGNFQR